MAAAIKGVLSMAILGVASGALTACAFQGGGAATTSVSTGASPTSTSSSAAPDSAITIWSSMDERVAAGLAEGLGAAAQSRGITIDWRRIDDVDAQVVSGADAGDLPDIAFVSAPRVVGDLVSAGLARPLDPVMDVPALRSTTIPGVVNAGTVDSRLYGLVTSISIQGLVFYAKAPFDAAGLAEPTTIDELQAMVAALRADFQPAWCNGIESGEQTGWPATDLIESLMLRLSGTTVYRDWIEGDIPFTSPDVKAAFTAYADLYFADGYTFGGRSSIPVVSTFTAGDPLFDARPGCLLLQQGSFFTRYFPRYIQDDIDSKVGVFALPGPAAAPQPQVGGGQLAVLLSDNPHAATLMNILASDPSVGVPAAQSSSFISPFTNFALDHYSSSAVSREIAQIAYAAPYFTFDAGDVRDDAAGPAAFRLQTTAWIGDTQSLDAALEAIAAVWRTG